MITDKNNEGLMKLRFTNLVNETKEIPKLEVVHQRGSSYLYYGKDNMFPDYLWDLYTKSSQFASIVNTMVRYIIGNEIINNSPMKIVNRKGDTMERLIEKIIYDYVIFGGFAIQIIRNRLGEVAELNWLDFRYVRTNEDEDSVWYCKYWKKRNANMKVYERYNANSKQPVSVFYYKGNITRNEYPVPFYISALTALEISTQIPEYHLNNLTNGFHPNCIINFNNGGGLSEDVMNEIEEKLYEKFSGVQNASKFLLSFNDDTEHSTTIERLSDEGNVDIYNTLAESIKTDIYNAFRINKLLLGNAEDNTGFNKQAYIESFALYNKTVILPIQNEIKAVLNSVLGDGMIDFDEFGIDWSKYGDNNETSAIIE